MITPFALMFPSLVSLKERSLGRFAGAGGAAKFALRGKGKVSPRCPVLGAVALGSSVDVVRRVTGC